MPWYEWYDGGKDVVFFGSNVDLGFLLRIFESVSVPGRSVVGIILGNFAVWIFAGVLRRPGGYSPLNVYFNFYINVPAAFLYATIITFIWIPVQPSYFSQLSN